MNRTFKIRRKIKVDKFHLNAIKKGILKNEKLFQRNLRKMNIFICDTEEEFKKYSKYYYFSNAAGTCLRNGDVIVRSNDFLKRDKKTYENLIAHEINHSFWFKLYKNGKPVWLHEALATIIEGRLSYNIKGDFLNLQEIKKIIRKNKKNYSHIKYRYFEKDFNSIKKIKTLYSIWGHFAEFISNKKPRKLIKFMEDYIQKPTKNNYNNLFKKHFGKSVKEKFSDFSGPWVQKP